MVAHCVWNQNWLWSKERSRRSRVGCRSPSSGAFVESGCCCGNSGQWCSCGGSRRALFASAAGWCLLREVGDPWVIKETQAERWSHPSGFEARARCRACDLGPGGATETPTGRGRNCRKAERKFIQCAGLEMRFVLERSCFMALLFVRTQNSR